MSAHARILVVEDEPRLAEILRLYLERDGHRVTVVGDGRAAIEAVDRDPVDLVVLDLMLPGVSGEAVLGAIRERGDTPVLIASAKRSDLERISGLRMGADDYLAKPFNPHELTARVAAVLRRSGGPGTTAAGASARPRASCRSTPAGSSSIRPAGDTRVARRRARPADRPSAGRLTPGELGLLAALARRPGSVLTRDQLLERRHPPAGRGVRPGHRRPRRQPAAQARRRRRRGRGSSRPSRRRATGWSRAGTRRERRDRGAASARRRSLAWRLGLLLGVAVIAVLLLVGIVVNRVVSSSFETVLTDQQQQRLDDASLTLADRLSRPAGLARAQALVMRLATSLDGEIRVIGTDGTTLAAFGRAPDRRPGALRDADRGRRHARGDARSRPCRRARATAGFLRAVQRHARGARPGQRARDRARVDLDRRPADPPAARRGDRRATARGGRDGARATGGDDRESTELADAFNAMADRLERSEMLRRRAASDIAHDLATPATVLESQLQAMIDGVVPTDAAGLEAARSTAAALGGVVADIDDLARAEAAPLQARPAAVDLTVSIPEVALALDGQRRDRSARIDVEVEPGSIAVGGPRAPRPRAAQRRRQRARPQPDGGVVAVTAGRGRPARCGSTSPTRDRASRPMTSTTSSSASIAPTPPARPTR